MSQFDLFAIEEVEIGTAPPELDAWTRTTQRMYLTNLVRDVPRYKAEGNEHSAYACSHNARGVLMKLNGMGGQW
jgi:hypothetical protein